MVRVMGILILVVAAALIPLAWSLKSAAEQRFEERTESAERAKLRQEQRIANEGQPFELPSGNFYVQPDPNDLELWNNVWKFSFPAAFVTALAGVGVLMGDRRRRLAKRNSGGTADAAERQSE